MGGSRKAFVVGALVLSFAALALSTIRYSANAAGIAKLPEHFDKNSRKGRAKLYDECGDQRALFASALKRAGKEGKVLLVSFGAEWCIWCHVFDQYVHGGKTRFKYTYGYPDDPDRRDTSTLHERAKKDVTADARQLESFVAKSFVIVHIDSQYAPHGWTVLKDTGAQSHYTGGIPFIFTVNAQGQYAARLESSRVETRRDGFWDWYRGYSRQGLMAQLDAMHRKAFGN